MRSILIYNFYFCLPTFTGLFCYFCFAGDRCMPRSSGGGIIPLDLEIERTLRTLRKTTKNLSFEFAMADEPLAAQHARHANILQTQNQNEPRTLRDYLRPVVNENYYWIWRQTINANKFELKPGLIDMVQQ